MELKTIPHHLENEKKNFLRVMSDFVESVSLKEEQSFGRPRLHKSDLIKSLLVMSYHSWSYRRANSDLERLKEDDLIDSLPSRAVLNRQMNDPEFNKTLRHLVQLASFSFINIESGIIIIDSTWFAPLMKLSSSNYKKSKNRNAKLAPLFKTRKIHVMICQRSKIICDVIPSIGTSHDHNYFKELLLNTIKLGWKVKVILGDSAYNSKESYCLCEDNGIEAFLDFKKNHKLSRSKSALRRKQLRIYREHPDIWHKTYDIRPLIEIVFSAIIQTKFLNLFFVVIFSILFFLKSYFTFIYTVHFKSFRS